MRRWIALLMVAILSVQLSWAAAAPYCQHETDLAAAHFGHHAHQHDPGDDTAGAAAETGIVAMMADLDCGQCHHGACAAAVPTPAALPVLAPASQPHDFRAPGLPRPAAARPERPNWPVLA